MLKAVNNAKKIILVTEKLLEEYGRDEMTIRAVAKAAKVQSPTIYRIFKDKKGLLASLADYGFAKYTELDQKNSKKKNSMDELRRGWDFHVNFGCTYPQLYKLMYSEYGSVAKEKNTLIAQDGFRKLVSELAKEGYLCVSEEKALFILFASANGAITSFQVFGVSKADFDQVRENTIQSITKDRTLFTKSKSVTNQSIITLLANVDKLIGLSEAEKTLLNEWLRKIQS